MRARNSVVYAPMLYIEDRRGRDEFTVWLAHAEQKSDTAVVNIVYEHWLDSTESGKCWDRISAPTQSPSRGA